MTCARCGEARPSVRKRAIGLVEFPRLCVDCADQIDRELGYLRDNPGARRLPPEELDAFAAEREERSASEQGPEEPILLATRPVPVLRFRLGRRVGGAP
jgi:hypothetical protein